MTDSPEKQQRPLTRELIGEEVKKIFNEVLERGYQFSVQDLSASIIKILEKDTHLAA